ncbi:PilZ domain-containing protein [Geomonas anaerohicana]|uniref:PilZ domain-containing protein n=1 Tax=Geomonas anaerohicana TaxID=2798583 RepID=A0ABS0YJK8_9BACT|nr:PilZ domain-containing protein [Geomonas anaerohicana]MBJ6752465.1 PilZ domain-containing protein [Geomonas anaerohicana]
MTELRQFYRAPSSKAVELVHHGECLTGILENISFNGALLHLRRPAPLSGGTGCLLRIHLDPDPELRPPLQIWTEVVHASDRLLGVKFVDHDVDGSDCIALLMELMREEPDQDRDEMDRIRGYLADYCNTP